MPAGRLKQRITSGPAHLLPDAAAAVRGKIYAVTGYAGMHILRRPCGAKIFGPAIRGKKFAAPTRYAAAHIFRRPCGATFARLFETHAGESASCPVNAYGYENRSGPTCLAAPPGTARHTVHRIRSYHITCTTLIITSLSKYVRRLTKFGGPHHAAHCTRSADLMISFIVVCLPGNWIGCACCAMGGDANIAWQGGEDIDTIYWEN